MGPIRIGYFVIDKLNMPGVVNIALLMIVTIFVLVVFHERSDNWDPVSFVDNAEGGLITFLGLILL